jgi:hypothetical protein
MTPMLRELHEDRKARLQRMKAWHTRNLVPFHRVRPHPPKSTPIVAEPVKDVQSKEVDPPLESESPPLKNGESPTVLHIQCIVAKRYRVDLAEIRSDAHNGFVMLPRQIAYTLAKRLTSKSFPAIGRAFGGRDHTTILHGVRKIEERASRDPELAAELEQLERAITGKTQLPCPCCGSTFDGTETQMTYEDQVAIGNVFNTSIHKVLAEYGIYDQPELIGALAQELLVQLDRANYKIEKK